MNKQDIIRLCVELAMFVVIYFLGYWSGKQKGIEHGQSLRDLVTRENKTVRREIRKANERSFILADFINGLPVKFKRRYKEFNRQRNIEREDNGTR